MLPSSNFASVVAHAIIALGYVFGSRSPIVLPQAVECHCHCNVTGIEDRGGGELLSYGIGSLVLVLVAVVTWVVRTICCCRPATAGTLVRPRRGRFE